MAAEVTRAFVSCFFVHLAQFLLSTFLGPLFEVLIPVNNPQMLGERENKKKESFLTMTTIVEVVELLLRFIIVGLALWQLVILSKDNYDECLTSDEQLSAENAWMQVLVWAQAAFIIGFCYWPPKSGKDYTVLIVSNLQHSTNSTLMPYISWAVTSTSPTSNGKTAL